MRFRYVSSYTLSEVINYFYELEVFYMRSRVKKSLDKKIFRHTATKSKKITRI